jgi:3-(3-hydroxy-phenyl)propionate hydroxylase
LAASFQAGNVVLAGDAAHLNHPLGGMGLNSGIHDAYHLAESITTMLRDQDREPLRAYATMRRRIMEEVVLPVADRYWRDSEEKNADQQHRRNDELRAIAQDPAQAREWLIEASMFASSPIWRGDVHGRYHLPEPNRAITD